MRLDDHDFAVGVRHQLCGATCVQLVDDVLRVRPLRVLSRRPQEVVSHGGKGIMDRRQGC